MEEVRIDLREPHPERDAESKRSTQLCFKINHTMPMTAECDALIHELFAEIGENTRVQPPLQVNIGANKMFQLCTICFVCPPLKLSLRILHKLRRIVL